MGQALGQEPQPRRVRERKRRRERPMGLAERNAGWMVGFEEETW